MELIWTATAPGCLGIEQRTSKEKYMEAMETLMAQEEGYTEVHLADADYPVLALGFRGGRAVMHRFEDEETVYLLRSEGQLHDEEIVSMPSIEEGVDFESAFVIPVDEAWDLMKRFLAGGSAEEFGPWILL